MPDAILFDMDDTIVLWETPVEKVWREAVFHFRKELDGLEPEKLLNVIDKTRKWYWVGAERHRVGRLDLLKARREICRLAFTELGRKDLDLADKIGDTLSAEREKGSSIAPGTIELLKNLRERGMKLGMVTNGASDMQRAKISKFNLAPLFDHIQIEGEFECGKPDERAFRYALDKIGGKPDSAWMVGDNLEFDIAPCRPLGIYSLWVNGNSENEKPKDGIRPDKTIRSILEIPRLLAPTHDTEYLH